MLCLTLLCLFVLVELLDFQFLGKTYDLSLLFIQELRKGDLSIYIDEEIYEDAMIDNYLEEEYEILVELQEKNDKLYDNFL